MQLYSLTKVLAHARIARRHASEALKKRKLRSQRMYESIQRSKQMMVVQIMQMIL